MSNGQNIIDKILSDAKQEAAKIEQAAKAEAEKIILAANEKADKEAAKAEEAGKDDAQKASAKEISSAQMKAKQMILASKQKCIEDTVKSAKEQLKSLEGAEYKVVIINMLTGTKDAEGSEVILSAKDKEAFGADLEKMGYKISQETRPIESGFVLKKGDIEYNYSFESIISVEKEEIDQAAAKILFA